MATGADRQSNAIAASQSAGTVATSPNVETLGETRLSRSQSRRTATAVSVTVASNTTTDARIPPTTLTNSNCPSDTVAPRSNSTDAPFASTAKTLDIVIESTMAAIVFWPSTVLG